ncbi:MAG TPA: LEA type 2 family protein [Anaeromyxobacteraceae bacterium]|nr:LEA type 2 family protein [Anaeromyxobacteraceae bacterium]
MTHARPIALALLSLALASCAGMEKVIGGTLEPPRLELESLGLEAVDLEGATAVARYRVENPNGFGVSVARLSYRLEVEGQQVAAGALQGGLKLPARGTAPLVIPVRVRYGDVPAFLDHVAHRDRLAYLTSGTAGFDTPVGGLDVPWSHSGEVPVPKLPTFAVDSVKLSAGLFGVSVDLKVRVGNRNAFPIAGGRLEYRLDLNGSPAVRNGAAALATVPAGGSAVMDLPLKVDLLAAGLGAGQAIGSGRAEVVLSGQAAFGSLRIPVSLRAATR